MSTLGRLGMLELNGPSSWPRVSDADDTYPINWREVEGRSQGHLEHLVDANPEFDRWERVRDELQLLARQRGGRDVPPPLFDVDAWYQPIHYFGGHWGIFIRESAVRSLTVTILNGIDANRRYDLDVMQGALRQALAVYFLHEMFHHKVESFAIRLEIVERVPRYLPYRKAVYEPLRAQLSDRLLEEALATAESYLRLNEPVYRRSVPSDVLDRTRSYLASWIPSMPPGYRRAAEYLSDGLFDDGLNLLSSQLHESTTEPARNSQDWRLASHIHRGLFNCKASTWVVVPVGTRPLVPWFDETISGLAISTRKLVKGLRALGYVELADRGKGSHQMFRKEGHPDITVPGNREAISVGVLHETARSLGYRTVADMWANIRP
ncbi:MAG: type II toxin-antitoxin system HicA family toxin [Streptosporangiaceae bacterium]